MAEDGHKALFRAMKRDDDGQPVVERSARALGVRLEGGTPDIKVHNGRVKPHEGGMSTSIDPKKLAEHRRPAWLGGTGRDPLFVLGEENLGVALEARPFGAPHHFHVEPTIAMELDAYEAASKATRPRWEEVSSWPR